MIITHLFKCQWYFFRVSSNEANIQACFYNINSCGLLHLLVQYLSLLEPYLSFIYLSLESSKRNRNLFFITYPNTHL